jgi:hypothetical protein
MKIQAWRELLWQQFGAAIDMRDNAIVACLPIRRSDA